MTETLNDDVLIDTAIVDAATAAVDGVDDIIKHRAELLAEYEELGAALDKIRDLLAANGSKTATATPPKPRKRRSKGLRRSSKRSERTGPASLDATRQRVAGQRPARFSVTRQHLTRQDNIKGKGNAK